jgi:hypothetical protein
MYIFVSASTSTSTSDNINHALNVEFPATYFIPHFTCITFRSKYAEQFRWHPANQFLMDAVNDERTV